MTHYTISLRDAQRCQDFMHDKGFSAYWTSTNAFAVSMTEEERDELEVELRDEGIEFWADDNQDYIDA